MTKAEWLACTDPQRMLQFLRFKYGVRKVRLFTVACHRQRWHHLDDQSRKAVEAAEELANNRQAIASLGLREAKMDADAAAYAAWRAAGSPPDCEAQAGLLRDIFNPFHLSPPLPSAALAWNDGTVHRIAEGIYEERAFARMPILADALLDAGCDNEDILAHCREPGPHVRGCWVIDLILGKA